MRQADVEGAGGTVAGVDHVLGATEVRHAVGGQRRLDQHVLGMQVLELFFGVAPGHQGDGLIEYIDHGGQLLARTQRGADVHDDGDIDAHFPRHVQRDVIGHAAVHQQPAVQFHRGEYGRNRHAGTDHLGQMAFAEHHFFARGDVGGHGTERDGQLVEVTYVAAVGKHAFQQQRQVLALDHPQGQAEAAVIAEAEFLLDQEIPVILLASKRYVFPRRCVRQGLLPVDTQCEFFQLIDLVARCIQTADDRAHAGAGDRIDVDTLFFKGLEYADMRQATGRAAGQHQADFRARGVGGVDEEGQQAQQQAGQQAAHHESRGWAIKAGIIVARPSEPVTPGTSQIMSASKPEIVITYCTQCQWLLRAAWLAQELLSTFADDLGKVSLEPATGGAFRITCDGVQIWERKADGGFPEAKVLKQRVRDRIDPQRDLGHNDRTP